jgi:histidine triad (HIT) family protein
MNHCIFCDVLAGQAPASIVFQDDLCCAIMDIQPVNPGHVLIIPARHAAGLAELDAESGAHLFRVGQRIAAALRGGHVRCEGVNLMLADGLAAGQTVFHVHLHVIPRFRGDGFGLRVSPEYGRRPAREELDIIAERLRNAL